MQRENFLFISKVLGKHLEVKPDIVKATGKLLLSTKYNDN
ncbi:MAG: phosphoribosyltransferase domain-containing protein [Anaerobutyricum soehngenii]